MKDISRCLTETQTHLRIREDRLPQLLPFAPVGSFINCITRGAIPIEEEVFIQRLPIKDRRPGSPKVLVDKLPIDLHTTKDMF